MVGGINTVNKDSLITATNMDDTTEDEATDKLTKKNDYLSRQNLFEWRQFLEFVIATMAFVLIFIACKIAENYSICIELPK